jgi:hypothetical protein
MGSNVKYRWLDKDVNIFDVEKAVRSFLEQQSFTTTSSDSADPKKIAGVLRGPESTRRVIITVSGKPNDFTVDFSAGEVAQLATKFASLITFFGGGLIELKSLREKEFYEGLEDQFWKYLEEFVEKKGHRRSIV